MSDREKLEGMSAEQLERVIRSQDISTSMDDALSELVRRLTETQQALAEAATEINCAGPVAHRIRIMKREHGERVEEMERRLTEAEQERDRLRGRIVKASDALAENDTNEAYHELYAAVDPDFASMVHPFERWREHAEALEAHAK
jgi:chromosome segregation ATPase